MAKGIAFTTAVKNREPFTFTIDDIEYHFTPGKRAGMTLAIWDADSSEGAAMGVGKGLIDWLSEGLPEGEQKQIRARLLDPKDDFDSEDLNQIAQGLLEAVSGRPFTSPSASPVLPATTGNESTPTPPSEASTPSTSPSTDSSAG